MTEAEAEKTPAVLYICKPEAGCQGRGIFISNNFEQMKQRIDTNTQKHKKEYEEYLRQEEQNDTKELYASGANVNVLNNDQQQVAQ